MRLSINVIGCLIYCLSFLSTSFCLQAQEYPLTWRFEKGMIIRHYQTNITTVERMLVNKNTLQVQKQLGEPSVVTVKYISYWNVMDLPTPEKVNLAMHIRNGVIEIRQGERTISCEVENPADAEKLKSAVFQKYAKELTHSLVYSAFIKGPKTGTIENTWLLKRVDVKSDGKKETASYQMVMASQEDPFNLDEWFKQLPNKPTKIGTDWKVKSKVETFDFEKKYKFSKIQTHRTEKHARIDFSGSYKDAEGKKAGSLDGYFLFNLERLAYMYLESKKVTTVLHPVEKDAEQMAIMERTTVIKKMDSVTNASKIKNK